MNKRIEAVLNNKESKATDYFELVNVFCSSNLYLQKEDKKTAVSMEINEFKNFKKEFEFLQKCTNTNFTINEKDIKSVSGKMQEGTDMFFITVEMVDGATIYISIPYTDTNTKTEVYEHYEETDVFCLKEYFENEKHNPRILIIEDMFGLVTRFDTIDKISLIEDEYSKYTLQILHEDVEVNFPLVDDACNDIYIKQNGFGDTILIRPYGQPFMEIKIIVTRN